MYNWDSYVNKWTDAVTKGKMDGEETSTVVYWFAPGHLGNWEYVLNIPITKNNNYRHSLSYTWSKTKSLKIWVKTDLQYIADLYNGN